MNSISLSSGTHTSVLPLDHNVSSDRKTRQHRVRAIGEVTMLTTLSRRAGIVIALALGCGFLTAAAPAEDLAAALAKVEANPAPGPHGEQPVLASDIKLSPEELEKIKAMKAKAAIVMHYTATEWAQAQMKGQRDAFKEMGVEIIAVTDAGYKPEQQVTDIETVLAQKPNIIISAPAEEGSTAEAYRKAAQAGVKLVFIDQTGKGLKPGDEYVSLVSSDNRGMGVVAALLMADALKGKGEIGLIPHASDLFATHERYVGFKEAIKAFPDIKIVADQGIGGPDFSGAAERVASGMLTTHPRLNGIWAVWDVPTEGVLSAARSSGRDNDLVVTTCDLGANIAIDMAENGYVKGTGSQRPYRAGYAEALLAGYALLGKPAPSYVVLPALPVTKANILEAWRDANGGDPPDAVMKTIKDAN
jgi:ribose transport system substrate-binding protein